QTLKFYKKILRPKAAHDETVRITQEQDYAKILAGLKAASEQAAKSSTEILEIIFGAAVFYKSSDIHLEPEDHMLKVRFRVDGVLQDMMHLVKSAHRPLVTRIKMLSKLKLNVENIPQDGRMTFYYL